MANDDTPTCGKGLAEHAAIPKKLGDLIGGLADNLEQHLPSLTAVDPATRAERTAYESLLAQHRRIAEQLHAVAAEMDGYRGLLMGAHDEQVLESPAVIEAFQRYVVTLRQTIATLQANLASAQQMLPC
jgi:hypothetical protein